MEIRKLYTQVEEIINETGRQTTPPLKKVAVVAVVRNPHAGREYVAELGDLIEASTSIGRKIASIGVAAMG